VSFDFVKQSILRGFYEPEGIYLHKPFEGRQPITQLWGENPQHYGRFRPGGVPLQGHNGIDFGIPNGTKLFAVDRGRVIEIGNDSDGYGRYLKLQHRWGESLYAHMQGFTVEAGQFVKRGQVIGYSDNTGASAGPHLHLGIRVHPYDRSDGWGGYIDPLPFLDVKDVILPPYARQIPNGNRVPG
jgi:murein DD-endopeptidase MepM/ murein hydrolase activator NlpD